MGPRSENRGYWSVRDTNPAEDNTSMGPRSENRGCNKLKRRRRRAGRWVGPSRSSPSDCSVVDYGSQFSLLYFEVLVRKRMINNCQCKLRLL